MEFSADGRGRERKKNSRRKEALALFGIQAGDILWGKRGGGEGGQAWDGGPDGETGVILEIG